MKRGKSKTGAGQIRLVAWQVPVGAAVAAASLVGAAALAAPGDLDPSFGDAGRKSGIAVPWSSTVRSVELQDDDSIIFGGGGEYDYYDWYDDFLGRLLPDGSADAGFVPAVIDRTALYDTALQSDGKLVGVGVVRQPDFRQKLVLFRLLPGGALDASFGLNGLVVVNDGTSGREAGYAVVVDPDDRIVVAGQRGPNLLVLRMLPNGAPDASFGTGGVFTGPEILQGTPRIARVPAGGYRLIAMFTSGGMGWGCQVVGLTASGVLDVSFDTDGYALPPAGADGLAECTALAVQPDGRAVVGGRDSDLDAFVDRLLANGTADPAFDGGAVADRLRTVSTVEVSPTGKTFVAGTDRAGLAGAQVVRLLADGTLDAGYGRSGTATLDPQVRLGEGAVINDMQVGGNDSLVVAGSVVSTLNLVEGFVARLRGDDGGGGPGVLSVTQRRVLATEAGGSAVLAVRRTGGSTGAIAVTYGTSAFPWTIAGSQTYAPGNGAAAEDFTAATGRLTWADGDVTEREIVVPIVADAAVEQPEWFAVELSAPEGGAGLGFQAAEIEIAGTSYPHGDIELYAGTSAVREGETASFYAMRNYYAQGAVTVTVRLAAGGTATSGEDFRNASSGWQDVVVSWADGESGGKYIPVQIVADGNAESAESFTLELVAPTGGALLGVQPTATLQIASSTAPPPPPVAQPPKSRSGGGAFGWLGALLLGLAGWRRSSRRPHGGMTNA